MNCCCETDKKNVKLVFRREQLLYDISNYAFVEGDLLGDDAEHIAHQLKDIAEEGNVDRVTRVLNLAHTECVEMLYPYTKKTLGEDEVMDDTLEIPDTYEIEMTVPATFARTTMQLLVQSVHEYMVCRVLQDWLSMTSVQSAPVWDDKLQRIKQKIQSALLSRMRYVRRKLKPF